MSEKTEPQVGEWWMVQSNETKRTCPMLKTPRGWASIQNADGKPSRDHIQTRSIFTALFKMVPA